MNSTLRSMILETIQSQIVVVPAQRFVSGVGNHNHDLEFTSQ